MKYIHITIIPILFLILYSPHNVIGQEEAIQSETPQQTDIPEVQQKSLGQKIKQSAQDFKETFMNDLSKTKEELKGVRNFNEDLKNDLSKAKDGFVEFSDHVGKDAKTMYHESKHGFSKEPPPQNEEEEIPDE